MSASGRLWLIAIIFSFVLVSCLAPRTPGGDGDGDADADSTERDVAQYVQVQADLENGRSEFQGEEAGDFQVAGDRVYWLHGRNMSRPIYSHDFASGQEVHHQVNAGAEDNFRVSADAFAVAEPAGQEVIYHVYDANEVATEITTAVFDAPQDEQRWWAYAVDGTDLYVVTTGEVTSLYRTAAGGQPVLLTTLEDASGAAMGEFWEFGVEDGMMIYTESGRIWQLDLLTNRATWLENETEVGGWVNFTWDGILFETAVGGPWFFDYATRQTRDISEAIAAASYQLNSTYRSIHLYEADPTRWRDYIIYVGSSGLFAFNMTTGEVFPLLLEPRCDPNNDIPRVDYRYPVVTTNGTLLTTGLTSFSCSSGAEGPIYQLDLDAVLP